MAERVRSEAPRVVVFGYDELALATVGVVRECGGEVAAVVFPATRRGDWRVERVRGELEAGGLTVLEQPPAARIEELATSLEALEPDLILVWSYPMLVPAEILTIPRLASLNLHMGLLPEYRGPDAIPWAIANGESVTGVTLHEMDEGFDTGPMLARARVSIHPDDDIVDVLRNTRRAGLHLLRTGWVHYTSRRIEGRPQDPTTARTWPRRTDEDDRIAWEESAIRIRNLVRATARPSCGAHTLWRDTRIVVRRCTLAETLADGRPGLVHDLGSAGIRVATGAGNVLLTAVELEGRLLESEGLAELGVRPGDCFG